MERSIVTIRLDALWRLAVLSHVSKQHTVYLLTEFPKSGGTWLAQMLSASLKVPFPQHRFPPLGSCIMQGHHIRHFHHPKTIVLWRDPRDIMVSWYHHCLFPSEKIHPGFAKRVRDDLGFDAVDDVRGNLPAFIEYSFTRFRSPRFTWNDFFDSWYGAGLAIHTKYEALRADPCKELTHICSEVEMSVSQDTIAGAVERYSFERMTGRKPGQEEKGAFIRKGIVGDWINYFSIEAANVLAAYIGDRIVKAGYEKDAQWNARLAHKKFT